MARLESQADLNHVPTPDVVCDRLAEFLDIPPGVHALDPCCGSGAALRRIVGPDAKCYGIELDVIRARNAQARLDRVLCCAAQEAKLSHGAFGLIVLNPPYDISIGGRLELTFLERSVNWLMPGGVLVFIIKRPMYTGRFCSVLARNFTDFEHWRFPDPYYDGPELAFGQTVLVCRRKHPASADPDRATWLEKNALDPFFPPGHRYAVPLGAAPMVFVTGHLTEQAALDLMAQSPVKRIPSKRSRYSDRSPLPLKRGHVALMLASGLIDGVYRGRAGKPTHVAKGTVRRAENQDTKVSFDNSGKATVIIKETQGFEIVIRALTSDGDIHDIAAPKRPPEPAQITDDLDEEAA